MTCSAPMKFRSRISILIRAEGRDPPSRATAAVAWCRANTPAPIYECPNCNASGMENVARSVVKSMYPNPRPGNGGRATVYDLSGNKIVTYWVGWYESVPGGGGDPPRYKWYVTEDVTPSAVASAFSRLRGAYIRNGRSLVFIADERALNSSAAATQFTSREIPPNSSSDKNDGCWEVRGTKNAYDAAVSSAVRNEIRDNLKAWIDSDNVFGSNFWEVLKIIRLFKSPYMDSYDVPLVWVQPFLDGGSIAFRYNWSTDRLEHIEKTIEDCDGNTVPEKKSDIDGAQFRIRSNYSREIFIGYIGHFGGTVSFNGSKPWKCSGGTTPDGRVQVTCSQF
jgi:hypothetical protein